VSTGISTSSHCKGWVVFQVVSLQLLVNGVHLILITRGLSPQPIVCLFFLAGTHYLDYSSAVYALYNRSRAIAILLSSFFVAENVFMTRSSIINVPKITWTATCASTYIPSNINWFSYGSSSPVIAINALMKSHRFSPCCFDFLLLSLTLWKSLCGAPAGWRRTPLLVLLVRDGVWAFFIVFRE
jgi:hypothetical protein